MIESRTVKYSLLERVNSPEELKELKLQELPILAEEVRKFLLDNIPKTGGHLSSNLGSVEFTIALHYVFDSPKDKIIWDTGHQAYTHKLLTGRREKFPQLRQLGGLSGFLKREESIHDIYGAGHASTSIACALGFNNADDTNWTIAVIGDSALTGGLALTALNNACLAKRRFMVVLNDNGMGIDKNVGTIARYLSTIKSKPPARKLNALLRKTISRLPFGEPTFRNIYNHIKDYFFYFFMPGTKGAIFEELGFSYFGPFNGHDVIGLVKLLNALKKIEDEPIFLHVITKKGKGFAPSEKSPTKWHGVSAGTILVEEEGEIIKQSQEKKATKTFTEVLADTLVELAAVNQNIVAITAAMPTGTGLSKFAGLFPDRFYDVGISEDFAVVLACGLALQGKRPVCAIYSTFLQRAFDQLIHDVAIQNIPVIFAIDRAGIVGEDGETHMGIFDISFLRMIPNFTIMAPKDENELRSMFFTAVSNCDGPTAIRYPKGKALGVEITPNPDPIPIGSWDTLRRGTDVAILAVGPLNYEALRAADILERSGISTSVINARFIKPMDEKLLRYIIANYPLVVTLEEHVVSGGFGAGVLENCVREKVEPLPRFELIGLPDKFIEQGDQVSLRKKYGLTAESISSLILERLKYKEKDFKVV